MKPIYILAMGTLLMVILSACGGAAPEEISNPEPIANTTQPATALPPTTQEVSSIERTRVDSTNTVPRELSEKAKGDLAGYLNINTDLIQVVEARIVDWPDTSLGCPKSDTVYAQLVTPGYWILLEANGRQYPYHTDLEEQVILCLSSPPNAGADVPPLPIIPVNPTEIKDGQPWVPVN